MRSFDYARPASVDDAIATASAAHDGAVDPNGATAKFIAGGTNLIDLMKADVARPSKLIDLTRLPIDKIEDLPDGGLRLGALAKNADTAYDERVAARYPMLARAILAGASAQLRNMATDAGNLLQRTRCYYFYDVATRCNKRQPGSGCDAIDGVNRIHAILGASDQCIATHPSDMCVALAALEAVVRVKGPDGERDIPFADFHRLPGDTPNIENNLAPDEIILSIDLPAEGFAEHYTYLKVRDRASYAFALVSVAAGLRIEGGAIVEARLVLGGVAHKPWRDSSVEAMLVGQPVVVESFAPAAAAMVAGAKGYEHNAFKIELAKRAVVRGLAEAAGLEPKP